MKHVAFLLLFLLSFSAALADVRVTAEGNRPAVAATSPSPDPGSIVRDVYQFALMIGGLLAFGAIVFGAIKYTLAAGNPSGQHEGREWITQALLGLLLLVGATVVLRTINPELLSLTVPEETCVLQPDGTKKCEETLPRLKDTPNTNSPVSGKSCIDVPSCTFTNFASPANCPTFAAPCSTNPETLKPNCRNTEYRRVPTGYTMKQCK